MALLVADCPRCGSNKVTFDVKSEVYCYTLYEWQSWFEIFCICRACHRPTIFLISLNDIRYKERFSIDGLVNYTHALNAFFKIERFISLRDNVNQKPPEYLPEDIESAFMEGATCLSIGCYNAAATMFRLCVDLVTRPFLPDSNDTTKAQPNAKTRRDLGLRLGWLFENSILPPAFRELAKCIREDANDGAHVGNLTRQDSEDLLDFTIALLEGLITEPKKLELAEERRKARRTPLAPTE